MKIIQKFPEKIEFLSKGAESCLIVNEKKVSRSFLNFLD